MEFATIDEHNEEAHEYQIELDGGIEIDEGGAVYPLKRCVLRRS